LPKLICPKCGAEMKVNKHGAYVCPTCKGVFLPDSMFGVT
jgi:Zn-finger nucleic acid-binding protein